ncbi:MAG: hypothetical protein MHM6MM_001187 [Cercozoa sp. M6MM]
MSGSHLSRHFFALIKAISEAKSKDQEDRAILRECVALKQELSAKHVPVKQMQELLVRAVYVNMLGHNADIACVHAINAATSAQKKNSPVHKRTGYLVASLLLSPSDPRLLLIVRGLQDDLKEDAPPRSIAMALDSVARLASVDWLPAVAPLVLKCLDHKVALIRKKAVMAVLRMLEVLPSSVPDVRNVARRMLCDRSPAVMGASLHMLLYLARQARSALEQNKEDAEMLQQMQWLQELAPSLVSILQQIIEHNLPSDYDYYAIPAPWLQVRLLSLLRVLGQDDRATSEQMYTVLHDVMKRADILRNVGYAIVHECVRTVATIAPNRPLIEAAAKATLRFLAAESNNLRYLGIEGLASLVRRDASLAASQRHQLLVVECLDDPDATLRRKTLGLLARMTRAHNAGAVVARLQQALKNAAATQEDVFFRAELVRRISSLSLKFALQASELDAIWYLQQLQLLSANAPEEALKSAQLPQGALTVVGKAFSGSPDSATLARQCASLFIVQITESGRLPAPLEHAAACVLGECADCSADVIDALVRMADGAEASTRAASLNALLRLAARAVQSDGSMSIEWQAVRGTIDGVLRRARASPFPEVQQRAHEFGELLSGSTSTLAVLSTNTDIDIPVSALDSYVAQARQAGAAEYSPPADLLQGDMLGDDLAMLSGSGAGDHTLNFDAYVQQVAAPVQVVSPSPPEAPGVNLAPSGTGTGELGLDLSGVTQVWSAAGYAEPAQKPESEPEVSTPPSIPPPRKPRTFQTQPPPQPQPRSQTPAAAPVARRKQKRLAAALFAGPSSPAPRDTVSLVSEPVLSEQQRHAASSGMDLDDLLGGFGGNAAIGNLVTGSSNAGPGNLLDDLMGLTQQVQQPPHPVQEKPTEPSLSPLRWQTSHFGQAWTTTGNELRSQVSATGAVSSQVVEACLTQTGFGVVQTIRGETIAAADLGGKLVLAHVRLLRPGALIVTVKSADAQAANHAAGKLLAAF